MEEEDQINNTSVSEVPGDEEVETVTKQCIDECFFRSHFDSERISGASSFGNQHAEGKTEDNERVTSLVQIEAGGATEAENIDICDSIRNETSIVDACEFSRLPMNLDARNCNPCKRKRVPSIEFLENIESEHLKVDDESVYQREKTPCTNQNHLIEATISIDDALSMGSSYVECTSESSSTENQKSNSICSGNELSLCKREDISHVLDNSYTGAHSSSTEPLTEDSETGEINSPCSQGQDCISQTCVQYVPDLVSKSQDTGMETSVSEFKNPKLSITFQKPSFSCFQLVARTEKQPSICETRDDSMFHINDFPSNILIQIFKNLSMYQLLHCASHVCRLWHQLSHDPDLWRVIDLRHQFKVTDGILFSLSSYSDRVVHLDISDAKLLSEDIVRETVTKSCHLMTLKLSRCMMITDNVLHAIGKNCKNLHELSIEECYKVTASGLSSIASGCSKLTRLHLANCRNLQSEGVEAIGRGCHKLQQIRMESCLKVENSAVESLSNGCPDLELVAMQSSGVTDYGVSFLHKLTKLKTIDISDIRSLLSVTVTTIARYCSDLEIFNISLNPEVDDSCLQSIAYHCKKLTKLYCVSCAITDNGLEVLSKHCKTLTYLDVGWCKEITHNGVRYLSIGCPVLTYIGLIRCDKVDEAVVDELVVEFPKITFSTFVQESRKLIERAKRQGIQWKSQLEKSENSLVEK